MNAKGFIKYNLKSKLNIYICISFRYFLEKSVPLKPITLPNTTTTSMTNGNTIQQESNLIALKSISLKPNTSNSRTFKFEQQFSTEDENNFKNNNFNGDYFHADFSNSNIYNSASSESQTKTNGDVNANFADFDNNQIYNAYTNTKSGIYNFQVKSDPCFNRNSINNQNFLPENKRPT
jgi:hypothetical protein